MVYDLFTFFNELDLLEIRLNLLCNRVDKFILVEATTTFSGKQKPLYYRQNKERYAQFNDKIIHIIVDDLPINSKDRWPAEEAQRFAFVRGLTDAHDNDIVILSDVDEIWNPEALPENVYSFRGFKQKNKAFFLNAEPNRIESYSVVAPYMKFKKRHPNFIRRHRKHFNQISDGGWHWPYSGGYSLIRKKLESFSHAELDNEPSKLSWIRLAERQKKNCYLPPESDPDWPQWLKDNWRKYSHLVIEK